MLPEVRRTGQDAPQVLVKEPKSHPLVGHMEAVVNDSAGFITAKDWEDQEALDYLKAHTAEELVKLAIECGGRWRSVIVKSSGGSQITRIGSKPGRRLSLPEDFFEKHPDIGKAPARIALRGLVANSLILLQHGVTSFAEAKTKGIRIKPTAGMDWSARL